MSNAPLPSGATSVTSTSVDSDGGSGSATISTLGGLFAALEQGDAPQVRRLLNAGGSSALLKQVDDSDQTALHVAARAGHEACVELLLRKKAMAARINQTDVNGWTALHCALSGGHAHVAHQLLSLESADASLTTKDNTSAMHYLLRACADCPPVLCEEVLQLLLKRGGCFYTRNVNGEYPLHFAAWRGNYQLVRQALQEGVVGDVVNARGETPLHYAAMTGRRRVVELLLGAGLDRWCTSYDGQTALAFARQTLEADPQSSAQLVQILRGQSFGQTRLPLHEAARRLDHAALEGLVPSAAATELNGADHAGMTPLHYAAAAADAKALRCLLQNPRADPSLPSAGTGYTVLHYLARHIPTGGYNTAAYRELLKQLGGRCDVNAQNQHGETPLHLAALHGNELAISYLLQAGARPAAKSSRGHCCLCYAVFGNEPAAVKLLIEHAAPTRQQRDSAIRIAIASNQAAVLSLLNYDQPQKRRLHLPKQLRRVINAAPAGAPGSAASGHFSSSASSSAASSSASSSSSSSHSSSSSSAAASSSSASAGGGVSLLSGRGGVFDISNVDDPSSLFDLHDQVGEGAHGSVFKARFKPTDTEVAVKMIHITTPEARDSIKNEIDILERCSDANIVKYHGCFFQGDTLWVVMDFCGLGAVADLRGVLGSLSEEQIAAIVYFTLHGVSYLHSLGLIHRDLKSDNLLLTHRGELKIADFGVSAQLTKTAKAQTTIGTPLFMSPEVLDGQAYDSKADIWSLGVTLIEMADGVPPHHEHQVLRAMMLIAEGDSPTVRQPEQWSEQLLDFLACTLRKRPSERPSAQQLLSHPFMARSDAVEHAQTLKDLVAQYHRAREAAKAAEQEQNATRTVLEDVDARIAKVKRAVKSERVSIEEALGECGEVMQLLSNAISWLESGQDTNFSMADIEDRITVALLEKKTLTLALDEVSSASSSASSSSAAQSSAAASAAAGGSSSSPSASGDSVSASSAAGAMGRSIIKGLTPEVHRKKKLAVPSGANTSPEHNSSDSSGSSAKRGNKMRPGTRGRSSKKDHAEEIAYLHQKLEDADRERAQMSAQIHNLTEKLTFLEGVVNSMLSGGGGQSSRRGSSGSSSGSSRNKEGQGSAVSSSSSSKKSKKKK